MVHLETKETFMYCLLLASVTFFLTPYILLRVLGVTKTLDDPCEMGFLVGFTIAMFLWNFKIKKIVYSKNKK